MVEHKLGLIWINYNSKPVINVVMKSLKSVIELLRKSENIKSYAALVDNNSDDGSWEHIVKFVKEKIPELLHSRLYTIKLKRNYLFAGGVNAGLDILRSIGVDYVALVNNDVIINIESVQKQVMYLSKEDMVGGVQGILLRPNGCIDAAGWIIDSLLNAHAIKFRIRKPIPVSYVSGSFSIYNFDSIRKISHGDQCKLLFQCVPAYYDDIFIGIALWSAGFKVQALPIHSGIHYHSVTFSRFNYLKLRNRLKSRLVLEHTVSTPYDYAALIKLYRFRLISDYLRRGLSFSEIMEIIKESNICARYITENLGFNIDIRNFPHIQLSLKESLDIILGKREIIYSRIREKLKEIDQASSTIASRLY